MNAERPGRPGRGVVRSQILSSTSRELARIDELVTAVDAQTFCPISCFWPPWSTTTQRPSGPYPSRDPDAGPSHRWPSTKSVAHIWRSFWCSAPTNGIVSDDPVTVAQGPAAGYM